MKGDIENTGYRLREERREGEKHDREWEVEKRKKRKKRDIQYKRIKIKNIDKARAKRGNNDKE